MDHLQRFSAAIALLLCLGIATSAFAQAVPKPGETKYPKVIQVDNETVKATLKPNGKPLLINFWATWCVPCVEEFPLLVQLDAKYKDQIDFITISLDDPVEKTRAVPEFLTSQKATMPAFLLYTDDENAVISSISKSWAGGLPFTILLAADGSELYSKQGLIKLDKITPVLDKAITVTECNPDEDL